MLKKSTANVSAGDKMLYRAMQEEGGMPVLGKSSSKLGARVGGPQSPPGKDIYADAAGFVYPGKGGMSVYENLYNIPTSRRPPAFGGTGKDTLFCIRCADLPGNLQYRPDPSAPPGAHGFMEPSQVMSGDLYNSSIWSTQALWKKP